MKVVVTKMHKTLYVADCTELMGSPPIGRGEFKQDAIINLLFKLIGYAPTQTLDLTTLDLEYLED